MENCETVQGRGRQGETVSDCHGRHPSASGSETGRREICDDSNWCCVGENLIPSTKHTLNRGGRTGTESGEHIAQGHFFAGRLIGAAFGQCGPDRCLAGFARADAATDGLDTVQPLQGEYRLKATLPKRVGNPAQAEQVPAAGPQFPSQQDPLWH
jgi:hypothetical protein